MSLIFEIEDNILENNDNIREHVYCLYHSK